MQHPCRWRVWIAAIPGDPPAEATNFKTPPVYAASYRTRALARDAARRMAARGYKVRIEKVKEEA